MTTAEFLRTVCAEGTGLLCIVGMRPGAAPWHMWFKSADEAASAALRVDAKGHTAYFALATFTEPERKASRAAQMRALWLDLDAGEGKPYPDQRAAGAGLAAFLQATGLPKPMVVNSGGGLHVYWPLAEPVPVEAWQPVALALKAACERHGLHADPVVTADPARILRPIGTHNRKRGDVEVRRVVTADPVALEVLRSRVGEMAPPAPRAERVDLPPELAAVQVEYGPKSAHLVADRCRQVGEMRRTRGNVPEPVWYGVITVLMHTSEAPDIVHEWSNGHPTYSSDETDAKIAHFERSGVGPHTCDKFREINPAGCSGCPHTVRSPIVLGDAGPAEAPTAQPEAQPEAPATTPSNPEAGGVSAAFNGSGETWSLDPDGNPIEYRILSDLFHVYFDVEGGMSGSFPEVDANGKTIWVKRQFARTAFYPAYRYYDEDGQEVALLHVYKFKDGWKQAKLPVASLASKNLKEHLAKALIMADSDDYGTVGAWLKSEINEQAKHAAAKEISSAFGWSMHGRGNSRRAAFVLGKAKLLPGGTETEVMLPPLEAGNKTSRIFQDGLQPHGSLDGWLRAVNVYAKHAAMHKERFVVSLLLGAPLMAMLGVNGAMVELYGAGGMGKTATAYVGLAAWGKPSLLMVPGNSTTNAIYAHAAMVQNLPVVIDEISAMQPQSLIDLTYSITQGEEKMRMASKQYRSGGSWCLPWVVTTNQKTVDKIAAIKANVAMHVTRVLEIPWAVGHVTLTDRQDIDAIKSIADSEEHYGHAGRLLVEYLLDHFGEAKAVVGAISKNLALAIGERSAERFYSHTCAVALAGAHFGKMLGLLPWDADDVRSYLVDQLLPSQRGLLVEHEQGPLEGLMRIINDSWQHCLIAPLSLTGHVSLEKMAELGASVERPRSGQVRMRMDLDTYTLVITKSALREECSRRALDMAEVVGVLNMKSALYDSRHKRTTGFVAYNVGTGTEFTSAPQPCLLIKLERLDADLAASLLDQAGKLRVKQETAA